MYSSDNLILIEFYLKLVKLPGFARVNTDLFSFIYCYFDTIHFWLEVFKLSTLFLYYTGSKSS